MKQIPIRGKGFVIVDDDDYEELSKMRWHLDHNGYPVNAHYTSRKLGKRKAIITKLHRLVIKAQKGEIVDHINHDKQDGRKENLRIVTSRQNAYNRKPERANKTGLKGVTYAAYGNKWRVHIMSNGKNHYLGSFTSPELAAKAYNEKAIELHGDHAYLNPI